MEVGAPCVPLTREDERGVGVEGLDPLGELGMVLRNGWNPKQRGYPNIAQLGGIERREGKKFLLGGCPNRPRARCGGKFPNRQENMMTRCMRIL